MLAESITGKKQTFFRGKLLRVGVIAVFNMFLSTASCNKTGNEFVCSCRYSGGDAGDTTVKYFFPPETTQDQASTGCANSQSSLQHYIDTAAKCSL